MITEEKVVCETPTPGKKPTRIAKWKYDAMRAAIRKSVPRNKEGVAFGDLGPMVEAALSVKNRESIGSLMWYMTTVKLHMEVVGELIRIPDSKPQRLRRPR